MNGHIFTRDFSALPLVHPDLNPEVFSQNTGNALVPGWGWVKKRVTKTLDTVYKDLPFFTYREKMTISARVTGCVYKAYKEASRETPKIHSLPYVRKQLGLLPKEWVCGLFDKATSNLWIGCQFFWYPLFKEKFFDSAPRFSVLSTTPSVADTSVQLFCYLLEGA